MGHDWTVLEPPKGHDKSDPLPKYHEEEGWIERHSFFRFCSGNHFSIWCEAGFSPHDLHQHSSEMVVAYMTPVIKVLEGLIHGPRFSPQDYETCWEQNPNFSWGTNNDGNFLDINTRRKIVHYQFDRYLTVAQENPGCWWFSDQGSYMGPYTDENGNVYKGLGHDDSEEELEDSEEELEDSEDDSEEELEDQDSKDEDSEEELEDQDSENE